MIAAETHSAGTARSLPKQIKTNLSNEDEDSFILAIFAENISAQFFKSVGEAKICTCSGKIGIDPARISHQLSTAGPRWPHVYRVALEERAQRTARYASARFPARALYPYAFATPLYETR